MVVVNRYWFAVFYMTDDQLTYQGNVDIDLLHADAMFQDANSNLFQNITIKQHIAMLYDAKNQHYHEQNNIKR